MSDLFHEDIPASYIEQVLLYRSGRELVASSSMSWMRRMVLWAELGGWALDHRYATRQLNHAYTVVLAAQFQGFCRDLHSESAIWESTDGASCGWKSMSPTATRCASSDRSSGCSPPRPEG